jgi:hypothetical protein
MLTYQPCSSRRAATQVGDAQAAGPDKPGCLLGRLADCVGCTLIAGWGWFHLVEARLSAAKFRTTDTRVVDSGTVSETVLLAAPTG